MKGISSIIAVVLILMITVALSAMAYVWFTDVFKNISGSAGEAAGAAASQIGSGFSIVSASGLTTGTGSENAYVRLTNTGTTKLLKENFNILINDTSANITSINAGELEPGVSITHTITKATAGYGYWSGDWCGKQVNVIYGDLEQVTTMACQ